MGILAHKTAKTQSRLRRSNAYYSRAKKPALSICPHCGGKKMPHRVCPHCGFYGSKQNGRQVITKAISQ